MFFGNQSFFNLFVVWLVNFLLLCCFVHGFWGLGIAHVGISLICFVSTKCRSSLAYWFDMVWHGVMIVMHNYMFSCILLFAFSIIFSPFVHDPVRTDLRSTSLVYWLKFLNSLNDWRSPCEQSQFSLRYCGKHNEANKMNLMKLHIAHCVGEREK